MTLITFNCVIISVVLINYL